MARDDNEHRPKRHWPELQSLCRAIHEQLYIKGDLQSARQYLGDLEEVIQVLSENDGAILVQEGLALYEELRGNLHMAIKHRKREIELMNHLYDDIRIHDYDEDTTKALLSGRDRNVMVDRLAIVRKLELASTHKKPTSGRIKGKN
jgi:hypothetical protein